MADESENFDFLKGTAGDSEIWKWQGYTQITESGGAGQPSRRGQTVFGCTAAHSLHNGCWKEEKANNFQARRVQQKIWEKNY